MAEFSRRYAANFVIEVYAEAAGGDVTPGI